MKTIYFVFYTAAFGIYIAFRRGLHQLCATLFLVVNMMRDATAFPLQSFVKLLAYEDMGSMY